MTVLRVFDVVIFGCGGASALAIRKIIERGGAPHEVVSHRCILGALYQVTTNQPTGHNVRL